MMHVWQILVRYCGWRLFVSALAGLAGGAALAALMRLIHRALTLPTTEWGLAALQFIGLIFIYFVGTVTAEHSLNDASERLQWNLRQNILRQLLARPLRNLERAGVPSVFGILSEHVKTVAHFVCWLPDGMVHLAIVVGCFGYMAWLSPAVLGFNILFTALAAACYVIPEGAAQRVGRAAHAVWDRHVGQMHFALLASRLLLLSRAKRLDFITRHFLPTGAELRNLNRRHRLIHMIAERFAEAFILANVACLLFVLPRFLTLSAETITGLLLAALFVRIPLKALLDFFPRSRGVRLSLERMRELELDIFTEPKEEQPLPASKPFRELVLENVTFHYENDHDQAGFSAGPFSLRMKAGEIIFLVGGNGAGKTTLAKLLCGLYTPAVGTITLDGAPVVTESERAALRERFAAVFTEDPVFSHLLGVEPEIVAKGSPALLHELRLAHKVELRGAEFSTTDLSQGQRRRLSLLGALLENRPLLLLDEWAADQDPEFRQFFYEQLLPDLRARGLTIVLITHDDRYFPLADRVIKLDSGQITPR